MPSRQSPLLDLPRKRLLLDAELLGGVDEVAVGISEGLLDLVLQLPVLDHAVERAFADAEAFGGFFAIAGSELERFFCVEAFDFGERAANERGRTGGVALRAMQLA